MSEFEDIIDMVDDEADRAEDAAYWLRDAKGAENSKELRFSLQRAYENVSDLYYNLRDLVYAANGLPDDE